MFMQQPEADRLVQAAVADLINGRFAQAASRLEEALRADPQHNMALTKQAELALYRKDHEAALALTGAVLAIEPNFAPAWYQRAAAFWSAGRKTDAVQAVRRAVDIQPPNPEFRLRLAQFSAWTGRGADTPEVLAPLLAAERHDPINHAAAVSMLGELAIAEGRFDQAPPYLDRALALQPSLEVTRMLRGMNQLRLGRYHEGWADYAAREAIPELNPEDAPPQAGQVWQGQAWHAQAWHGQALAGKTLLVTDDQGHGDAIQFFRYLPLLRDRGAAHVTWRTFPALVRLLGDAAPYATVLNALPEGVRFDFHCNSTSLPRWFGTELDSIPVFGPYLRPPSHLKSLLKRPTGRRLKVGLVWSGDARHTRDHLRSVPADTFLTLADLPGISFHSLQHEVRPADLPALNARPAIGREVEKAADFADTAALIASLDLVIAVDTGIAHLAGALGKPVWIVLHVAPDWRWLTERVDSPWYPSVRLFRVTPAEWLRRGGSVPDASGPEAPDEAGWDPILGRVATALRALAAG
jgi:tetratricopeptide (TPR) repeat protein